MRFLHSSRILYTAFSLLVVTGCGGGGGSEPSPTTPPSPPTAEPPPPPPPAPTPTPPPEPTPDILADIGVSVTVNMKHEVNGVSELDRSKFFTIHTAINDKDWGNSDASSGISAEDIQLRDEFFEQYDVYFGRNNGGMPWRLNRLRSTAVNGRIDLQRSQQLGEQDRQNFYVNEYNRQTESFKKLEARSARMMEGGQLSMYPQNELNLSCEFASCNNTNEWLEGFDALADYYVSYLSHYFGEGGTTGEPKPLFIEVMNEPILSASRYRTNAKAISDMHKVVATRIKQEHPDVQVGGYTAAWPALEERDFAVFDERWKLFIDTAGSEMDFYSVHLYDSFRGNKEAYRSGANAEAILDMLDQYSILALGEQKPWVVSEYGYFTPSSIERPSVKNVGYSKELDWLNVRSFSAMLFGFMERPDQIVSTIPFHLNKALWFESNNGGVGADGKRYGPRLFIMEDELSGEQNVRFDPNANWIYSDIVYWYQLWSEVKGTRVDSASTEIDVQADSYLDGNTLYIALNNLEKEENEIELNISVSDDATISGISSKHLFWDDAENSSMLAEETHATDLKVVTLAPEATMIVKVTFDAAPTISDTSSESKYFADNTNSFRKSIVGGSPLSFEVNGVTAPSQFGEAILRVGISRAHGRGLFPDVSINGTTLEYAQDYRGYYENEARDDFFGLLEIPVPIDSISENNDIEITFSDNGGTVSTAVLQVFSMSAEPARLSRN